MADNNSGSFLCASAAGSDWRVIAENIIEKIKSYGHDAERHYGLGYIYVSDHLVANTQPLLDMLGTALDVDHWVGGISIGIIGHDRVYVDEPSASIMLCDIAPANFSLFPVICEDAKVFDDAIKDWQRENIAMLVNVHADPFSVCDLSALIEDISRRSGGFVIGGLTSSREAQLQIADNIYEGGVSGIVFSSEVRVASTLSQGCQDIADAHTVTRASDQTIFELDGRRASEVFEEDLRLMSIRKFDLDPDTVMVDEDNIPEEFEQMFQGEVHAAICVTDSDQKDYMVRHITGFDADEGSVNVADYMQTGQRVMFVHRDQKTLYSDLRQSLEDLRSRVEVQEGEFKPKGALYVSCVARLDGDNSNKELEVIKDVLGDISLTGFYAGGEINNGRLYGYTGVMTLFL